MEGRSILTRIEFDRLLLGGIVLLIVVSLILAILFYATPAEPLQIPELQPTIRIAAEAGFPVGASRLRAVGGKTILVVRADERSYSALEGVSPIDGCILRWDVDSRWVLSPCAYVVYDLRGAVVAGLTTISLERYPVSVREGVVYVHLQELTER